jgi:hypothetical protein
MSEYAQVAETEPRKQEAAADENAQEEWVLPEGLALLIFGLHFTLTMSAATPDS